MHIMVLNGDDHARTLHLSHSFCIFFPDTLHYTTVLPIDTNEIGEGECVVVCFPLVVVVVRRVGN
jgi:hypothetical protein